MRKPLICVDFDGVLHSYVSGWKGVAEIPDPPMPGAMDWLREMYEGGFDVAIYSSRSKSCRGRRAMKAWLRVWIEQASWAQIMAPTTWELLYLEIGRWVQWPWFKPPAVATIDDRAIRFVGEWPTREELRAFKPWKVNQDVVELS